MPTLLFLSEAQCVRGKRQSVAQEQKQMAAEVGRGTGMVWSEGGNAARPLSQRGSRCADFATRPAQSAFGWLAHEVSEK